MDFDLSAEQAQIRDTAERVLRDAYTFEARRAALETDTGFSRDVWRKFADFGWLALPLSEASGGLGGSAIDCALLAEAMGAALVVEPFVPSVLLAGRLIDRLGTEAQRRAALAPMLAGEAVLGFAHLEPEARFDLAHVQTRARRGQGGWVLHGAKSLALAAAEAETIVLSARTGGADGDAEGISLFLVPRDAPGLDLRGYRTVDGHAAADLILGDVTLPEDALLGPANGALPALESVVDGAVAALCAEAVGAMAGACDLTLDYLKTREQFGQKIGKFQALQHRIVDMFMEVELSRSITLAATLKLDEGAPEARAMLSAAKSRLGRAGRFVGKEAIQLHGGMGMSQEYKVGHYYRRLIAIETMFGNTAWHRARYIALSRLPARAEPG